MLLWMLRLVLILVIIRLVWRFLSGVVDGAASRPSRRGPDTQVPLVRDPVCGTFVVRSRALTAGEGATLHYFCSERCRDAHRAAS